MSKKLLNERTIRRFGGLAGIKPATTSNFLGEMGEMVPYGRDDEEVEDVGFEEEEEEIEEPLGGEEEIDFEEEEEIEEPLGGEGEGDAEGLVMSLLDKVKEWAADNGVDMDVEGEEEIDHGELGGEEDLGDLGGEEDLELDMELGGDEGGEELEMGAEEEEEIPLEEMINSILAEDEFTKGDEEEWKAGKKAGEEEEESLGSKARERSAARRSQRGQSATGFGGRRESVEVLNDEKVIKEVVKRVKQRLTRIAKAQKRRR